MTHEIAVMSACKPPGYPAAIDWPWTDRPEHVRRPGSGAAIGTPPPKASTSMFSTEPGADAIPHEAGSMF